MHSKTRGGPRRPQNIRQGHFGAAKKYLGQHFLIDLDVLATIVESAELKPTDRVLEIGPGHGILTTALADALPSGLVVALEKDYDLLAGLRATFAKRKNVKIVSGDVLALPMSALIPSTSEDRKSPSIPLSPKGEVSQFPSLGKEGLGEISNGSYKVVANIPYNITSPIITKFLLGDYRGRSGEVSPRPTTMTLLVQKEMGERLAAPPGDRNRGILSVLIDLFGSARIIRTVPPTAFEPRPRVDSAILHIEVGEPKTNPETFHRLLKFGFANKRRQFHNALAGSLHLPTDVTARLLDQAGINPLLRAEQLTLEQWLKLHQLLLAELRVGGSNA